MNLPLGRRVRGRSFLAVVLWTRTEATSQSRQDCLRIKPLLATRKPQRRPAAAGVDPQLLEHRQGFGVVDHPIGDGRIQVAFAQFAPPRIAWR